jgi:hypothetical protein
VKTTFFDGNLHEEVFMKQLEAIVKKMEEIKVYTILKSLYGFCQAPISWYSKIDTYLKHQSLKRNEVDYNLYCMKKGIILAYDWK